MQKAGVDGGDVQKAGVDGGDVQKAGTSHQHTTWLLYHLCGGALFPVPL